MRLKRFALIVTLSALTAFGLAACDDDDNGTGPDTGGPPPAPADVQASVQGTSITVSWSGVSDADQYRAELKTTGEDDRARTVGASTTSATFSSLTRGKTYTGQVFAINDAGETGSGSAVAEIPAEESNIVEVFDDVLANTTWTSDKVYVLKGPIFVGEDGGANVTLTIEPGTTILGDVDPPQGARGSYLVVSRGSKLIADANADRSDKSAKPNPEDVIVFTSSAPRGQRTRGDWGGLVVSGRAPINSGTEAQGEGDSGLYGGSDPNDDSGILRGVRVEFAGDRVTATDELNGIAFQGVGAGTTVDYVQVAYNVDDGTEPFGGTVTQTHMVMTGIGDDSFDGTDGYQGFMQFLIAQQRADAADAGFEISNNGDTPDASPHSSAVIANATMVGSGVSLGTGEIAAEGNASDKGIDFREGSNYRIFNTIITGFDGTGMCVNGGQAAQNADRRLAGSTDPAETLRIESSILWANVDGTDPDSDANFAACGAYTQQENKDFFLNAGFNNMLANPNLPASAFSIGSMSSPPEMIPSGMPSGYTAFDVSTLNGTAGIVMPGDGRTLQATGYAGAVAPGTSVTDAWYSGWTMWSTDGSDSRPGLDEIEN